MYLSVKTQCQNFPEFFGRIYRMIRVDPCCPEGLKPPPGQQGGMSIDENTPAGAFFYNRENIRLGVGYTVKMHDFPYAKDIGVFQQRGHFLRADLGSGAF